jgi:hypothetical protein
MIDEMKRLSRVGELYGLLAHYAGLAAPDRQAWHDRRMEMDGVEPSRLAKLHGELLANGWLEQNTGLTPVLRVRAAPGCYRVTAAGLRALKEAKEDADGA